MKYKIGNVYYGDLYDRHFLVHYGIKGQKWGVRRYQNPDGSLTAAGRAHYSTVITGNENRISKEQRKKEIRNERISSAAGIGLGTAATAAGIGIILKSPYPAMGLRIVASGVVLAAISSASLAGSFAATRREDEARKRYEEAEIDKKTGLRLKKEQVDPEEDVKMVNPGRNSMAKGAENNCMLCTMSFELRRRGYEVTAQEANRGFTSSRIQTWFKSANVKEVVKYPTGQELLTYAFDDVGARAVGRRTAQTAIAELSKEPEGSRGYVGVCWTKGMGACHAMAYEIRDGKPIIYDAQIGKVYKKPEQILQETCSFHYARLDNLAVNYDTVTKEVINTYDDD